MFHTRLARRRFKVERDVTVQDSDTQLDVAAS